MGFRDGGKRGQENFRVAGMDLLADCDVLHRLANAEKDQIESVGEGGAKDGFSFIVLPLSNTSKLSLETLEFISLKRQSCKLSHLYWMFIK